MILHDESFLTGHFEVSREVKESVQDYFHDLRPLLPVLLYLLCVAMAAVACGAFSGRTAGVWIIRWFGQ